MRLLLSCVAARPSLTAGAAEPDGPDRARVMCLMMMTFAASPARCCCCCCCCCCMMRWRWLVATSALPLHGSTAMDRSTAMDVGFCLAELRQPVSGSAEPHFFGETATPSSYCLFFVEVAGGGGHSLCCVVV